MQFGNEINSEYDLLDRLRKGDHDAFFVWFPETKITSNPHRCRKLKSVCQ